MLVGCARANVELVKLPFFFFPVSALVTLDFRVVVFSLGILG